MNGPQMLDLFGIGTCIKGISPNQRNKFHLMHFKKLTYPHILQIYLRLLEFFQHLVLRDNNKCLGVKDSSVHNGPPEKFRTSANW